MVSKSFSTIMVLIIMVICLTSITTATLHASMSPYQSASQHILTGTLECSEEAKCLPNTMFQLTYDATPITIESSHNTIDFTADKLPEVSAVAFSVSVFYNSSRAHILDTSVFVLKPPGKKDQAKVWTHVEFELFKSIDFTEFVEPLLYVITFSRDVKNPNVQSTRVNVKINESNDSVLILDTPNTLLSFKGTTPSAHMVIGPYEPESDDVHTPYDNVVQLDIDLSWNNWDDLSFKSIAIYPGGASFIPYEEYEFQCLFGGQYVESIEVISDESNDGYRYFILHGIDNIIKRNEASFNGPNQLQIQCRFNPPDEETELILQQRQHFSFTVELITDTIDKHFDNYILHFSPPRSVRDINITGDNSIEHTQTITNNLLVEDAMLDDTNSLTYLTVSAIPPRSYIESIGDTPTAAIQSRFNRILAKGESADSDTKTKRYMSYYSIAYPLDVTSTLAGQKFVIDDISHFETMTVLLTGQEMLKTHALDYAHFYLRCIRQTEHFNLVRTFPVLFGEYDVETRAATGPGNNQISISRPKIHSNPQFKWPSTQEEFEQRQPCSSWSFDLHIGVYNENIPETMIQNSAQNSFAVRLRHNLFNTTALLRHDWVSGYDPNSAASDEVANNTDRFQIVNLKKNSPSKGSKDPIYYTFDMLVNTEGMTQPEDMADMMPFSLTPIGGNIQFLLPLDQKDGDDHVIEPITCNVAYTDKDGKDVTSEIVAAILTDSILTFSFSDEPAGLPYNTKDISVKCPLLKIVTFGDKKLNEYQTNIALQMPSDTFVVALFGKFYSPSHEGYSGAAKFGIFVFIVFLIILAVAMALLILNVYTDGKVVEYYKHSIQPCCKCCPTFGASGSSSGVTSDEYEDDQPSGTYGSYANSRLN